MCTIRHWRFNACIFVNHCQRSGVNVPSRREADTHMTAHPAWFPRRIVAISMGKGSRYEKRNDPSMPSVTVIRKSKPDMAASIEVSTNSCIQQLSHPIEISATRERNRVEYDCFQSSAAVHHTGTQTPMRDPMKTMNLKFQNRTAAATSAALVLHYLRRPHTFISGSCGSSETSETSCGEACVRKERSLPRTKRGSSARASILAKVQHLIMHGTFLRRRHASVPLHARVPMHMPTSYTLASRTHAPMFGYIQSLRRSRCVPNTRLMLTKAPNFESRPNTPTSCEIPRPPHYCHACILLAYSLYDTFPRTVVHVAEQELVCRIWTRHACAFHFSHFEDPMVQNRPRRQLILTF
jgi:hypothetical protein